MCTRAQEGLETDPPVVCTPALGPPTTRTSSRELLPPREGLLPPRKRTTMEAHGIPRSLPGNFHVYIIPLSPPTALKDWHMY